MTLFVCLGGCLTTSVVSVLIKLVIDNSIQFGVTMLDWGQSASKRGECVGVHWDPEIQKRTIFNRKVKVLPKNNKRILNNM